MFSFNNIRKKAIKRQELLRRLIPNSVSCEYIEFVDKKLPNGFEVETIKYNEQESSYHIMGKKNFDVVYYISNKFEIIMGRKIFFILP